MPTTADLAPAIRPLDRKACAALGHVGYVENRDAVKAFTAMFNMAARAPINAAVWADAGKDLDPDMLKHLRQWRNECTGETNHMPRGWPMPETAANASTRLRERFEDALHPYRNAFPPEQTKALAALRDHILGRIESLRQAMPFINIEVSLRMHDTRDQNTGSASMPHFDGSGFSQWSLRLLEVLDSDPTLIYANDDFRARLKDEPQETGQYGMIRQWDRVTDIRRNGLTAWQAPPNSILMITNNIHPWKPVLHSEPPLDKGRMESSKRILIVYNLAFNPGWMAKAAPPTINPG
jgi:hypothetical protein